MAVFFPENFAVYEIMWKNSVELGRPQMTVWRMRIACWIPKATNTLRICIIYCFSTVTVIIGTCLSVRLPLHCLSCVCVCHSIYLSYFVEVLNYSIFLLHDD